ncbi:MAG: PAS domain-containing sensor histidine kinase, partial [Frankiaceae bacterium]
NATLDVAGAVIVVVDADGRLLRFNRQAELLTGYREAEVLGRAPYEFLIPPEERSAVAANLQPVSPGQLVHQENHWMHRDGHRRLIHWSNAGLFDSQERLTHLIAVGIDVTDQRRLERQLRARADQAAIFASFAEGLATPGPEPGGVLERVTVQVAEFVGDTCGVFVVGEDGNTLSNLAWHSRRPEAVEFARRLVAARPYTIDTGPAVEVFRTGRTVVFSEDDKASLREQLAPEYRPLMDEFGAACAVYVPLRAAGNTLGVVVTYRFAGPDYTDDEVGFLEEFAARASLAYENARQGAERRRSQELLDAVFQMLPDLICIAGADGYFRVLNPAWEHTLGWTVDELCAQPYLDFVHPDDRLQTLAEHDRQTQHGEPVVTFENRYRCRDGSYRWLQWNSLPLAERGLLIANARDVTDRKQVEEALADSNRELERRSEELARSNRDLEQFAYIASHDLQEPLRMVSSYTSLLAEDLGDRLGETAARHLHYARDGAVRMQQLVNDLLRFSRVSRGADGDRERVDCDRLVAAVIVDLQEAIVPAGATVSHERLPTVTGVETELRQLFTNLIGNAVKFHGSEPVRVHVSAERGDAMWRFAVVDNGIGVDPAQAERVFEVFKRLHARGRYPGTGIGLAICKKVVEHHGGRIWVESTPGAGATFRFTLPAAVVEEAAP